MSRWRPGRWFRRLAMVMVLTTGLFVAGSTRHGPAAVSPGVGVEVPTAFGSLTVTDAHAGPGRVRVWVSLANAEGDASLVASPDLFRLGDDSAATLAPTGSTLTGSLVPSGSTVDGQVWFDLPEGSATEVRPGSRWLGFTAPDGGLVKVPLENIRIAPRTGAGVR